MLFKSIFSLLSKETVINVQLALIKLYRRLSEAVDLSGKQQAAQLIRKWQVSKDTDIILELKLIKLQASEF